MGMKFEIVAAMTVALSAVGIANAQPEAAPNTDPRNFQGTWMAGPQPHLTREVTPTRGRQDDAKDMPHSNVLWPVGDTAPPFTALGKAKFDATVDGVLNNRPIADPSTNCMPHGMPRIMTAPYGMQISQTKGLITIIFGVNHNVRLIHMDRPMPTKMPLTFNGYAVGHWEGDTLVVRTKFISGASVMDLIGTPHSDKLEVTEHIRKINDGKNLEDVMTIDDPVTFTQPWTARATMNWDNGFRLMEYVCEENNRNASDANGHSTAR